MTDDTADGPGEVVEWEDLDDHEREQFAAMVSQVIEIDDVDDAKKYYGNRERLIQDARDAADNKRMGDAPDDDPPQFIRQGPLLQPVPDHADRAEPLEPPSFDDYGKNCPECGANPDPWVGENIIGIGFDVAIIGGAISIVVEAECTCGYDDRAVFQR